MTIGPAPICLGCRRFVVADREPLTCDAFPSGIPEAIIMNGADHREPYPGDGGSLFDPVDAQAARYARELFDHASI
jgi:hypothetical protein